MTNDENNPGMSGHAGLNESPREQEGSGAEVEQGQEEQNLEGENQEEISLEELSELQAKAAKADENWDKYVRLSADFENYKKRAARERSEGIRYANEALIEKLLPVVDNFEAALNATNAPGASADSLKTGINMIYTQLKNFLNENGAEEIDAAGKEFDPNLHEAVSQQPTEEVPEGHVLQQMRKGYKLRERLVRPAMVVVAKKP